MTNHVTEEIVYALLLSIYEEMDMPVWVNDIAQYCVDLTLDEQLEIVQRMIRYYYRKGLIEFWWNTVKEVWPGYILMSESEVEQVFNDKELWLPRISEPVKIVTLTTIDLGDKYLWERLVRYDEI